MKIGIIGAMSSEVEQIKGVFNMNKKDVLSGADYYYAKVNNHDVYLACSGIGKVNAAVTTQNLINAYNVDLIINTGVAGGLANSIEIGDVVISKEVEYHDFEMRFLKDYHPHVEVLKPDAKYIDLAVKAIESIDFDHKYFVGKVVSGDQFIADKEVSLNIKHQFKADCVEMEAGAIAHVATINKVPFIIFRSISDNANDEAEVNFDEFVVYAANMSAKVVEQFIQLV